MKISLAISAAALACAACQEQPAPPAADEEALDGTIVTPGGGQDAPLAAMAYETTANIDCTISGIEPIDGCEAGVIRDWGEDSSTLVEVTKPDGFTRRIYFDPTGEPFGADGAAADGSAGWDFSASRQGDAYAIEYGPELYQVPEELVAGG